MLSCCVVAPLCPRYVDPTWEHGTLHHVVWPLFTIFEKQKKILIHIYKYGPDTPWLMARRLLGEHGEPLLNNRIP